jgi:hypothetical protein
LDIQPTPKEVHTNSILINDPAISYGIERIRFHGPRHGGVTRNDEKELRHRPRRNGIQAFGQFSTLVHDHREGMSCLKNLYPRGIGILWALCLFLFTGCAGVPMIKMPEPIPEIDKEYKSFNFHAWRIGTFNTHIRVAEGDFITIMAKG